MIPDPNIADVHGDLTHLHWVDWDRLRPESFFDSGMNDFWEFERRIVTTKTGFLGLAPAEAEAGDSIAIPYGCDNPVVLRSCKDGYRYVGECYIDGLMDGEAIEAVERGEYKEETITIV
ncbi:hypothetical protein EK21DRAFT_92947 [Setomelanomma holmii]|uniref:Uncharacterized protein n=1 Tax=Setomelanomma holmii TaxID=210430 RepID=A0A9P4H268_9PLEO|nr:hypothetical protein EK21DRAFT_92947 [Setomelanomma holmii]